MKKVTLIVIAVFAFLFSQAQYFDGVHISGKYIDVVNKFKAKGYTLSTDNEIGAVMKGYAGGKEVELYVMKTPKSNLAYKAVVFLPKESTWSGLKYEYNKYLDLLIGKYGDYTNASATFINPYYEGDGYETTAVSTEKISFFAYWHQKENANIAIEITKYMQVKIVYENVANLKIRNAEKEQVERNVF